MNGDNTRASYKYKFSVIMAVYGVEKYIDEAIASIMKQDIGFRDNVQIILVDDGSPDNSGQICDKYAAEYPDNIKVVHKENGGVSSARNAGIPLAEGEYVNFMDPDDKLSANTLSAVYAFFAENGEKTDIASIPIWFFGDENDQHYLNYKFEQGTRVIDLMKEPRAFQLSLSSSFVKNERAKKIVFDTRISVAEDAQQALKILIDKHYLGVVSEAAYFYRRRATSALANSVHKKGWYNDCVNYFSLYVLAQAKAAYESIPLFVQYAVMYELQWHLLEITSQPAVLTTEEFEEYKNSISECIKRIDDVVILNQEMITERTKFAAMALKYVGEVSARKDSDEIYYYSGNERLARLSTTPLQLEFLRIKGANAVVSVRQLCFVGADEIDSLFVTVNGEKFCGENKQIIETKVSFSGKPSTFVASDFSIPLEKITEKESEILFYTQSGDSTVNAKSLFLGKFFPVASKYKNSYYYCEGVLFRFTGNGISAKRAKKSEVRKLERKLRRELWNSNKTGERKAVIARFLASVYKFFHRKPIWIISDRRNKAGDNGEAFFRYLRSINYNGANCYFAIHKGKDYDEMKKLGKVVVHSSLKYKIMHLASDLIVSSQGEDDVTNPFGPYYHPYKDILSNKPYVFLQHGVTKDDISGWLNKYNKNISGFVVAAKPEAKSIFEYDYYYSEKEVWCTGFARFDRLYRAEKKYITVMPTWRRYLARSFDSVTGVWNLKPHFEESDYYKFYNRLLNDERILSVAKEYGYTLCFMPHPIFIPHLNLFDKHEDVKFFSYNDEYRDIYAYSNLLITDYSSTPFDFAYLRKPVVYTQFDKEDFFGGKHTYTQGYFDYERDGFGEVAYDYETTVSLIIEYIKNDCKMQEKYLKRADGFFLFDDQNNCKRIFDKIIELLGK